MPAVDRKRIESLAVRYGGPLRRFFDRRLNGAPDADDLVQDVFVRLIRHEDLNQVEQIDGYVFQIARNVLRDRHRRLGVRAIEQGGRDREAEHVAEDAAFSPERIAIGRETFDRLVAALHELPEKTRMIFTLYHIEGMSQVEIARRNFLSLSTVEKNMARANAHLLHRMGKLL